MNKRARSSCTAVAPGGPAPPAGSVYLLRTGHSRETGRRVFKFGCTERAVEERVSQYSKRSAILWFRTVTDAKAAEQAGLHALRETERRARAAGQPLSFGACKLYGSEYFAVRDECGLEDMLDVVHAAVRAFGHSCDFTPEQASALDAMVDDIFVCEPDSAKVTDADTLVRRVK